MFKPVLLHNKGRNGGKECAHKAVESPPVVLQDQASKNDEATQRVVDKHHLSSSTQNPVQQLQQKKLFWKMERENGHNTVNVVQVVVFSGSHVYSHGKIKLEIFYIINKDCQKTLCEVEHNGSEFVCVTMLLSKVTEAIWTKRDCRFFSVEKRSMCHDRKNVA